MKFKRFKNTEVEKMTPLIILIRKRKQRLLKKLNLILEMSDKVGQQTSDAMKLDDEKHYDRPSEKQTEEFAQKLQSKAKKQKSSRIQSHIFKNVLHALNWAIINGQKDEFDQEPPVTQSVSKTDDHVLLNRLIYPIRLVHLLDESTSDLQKDLTKEQRVKRLLYKIRRLEIVDDHDDINMN